MTSVLHIFLLFFALTGRCFSRNDALLKKYVTLISDVRQHYGASGVFFLFSRNERRLQEYTLVHFLSRAFSQKGILNLILNFENLDERTKYYRGQIVRPLIVVLLKTMSDLAEMEENTREMNTSYPIWLLIFDGEVGKPLCEYCARPVKNVLHLRFDTQMVVDCCGHPMITEWWSVRENRTEVANFGTWTEYQGLTLFVPRGLYSRRHNVYGAGLRMSIVTNPRLSQGKTMISNSYFGDVLMELKRAMNFTITSALPVEAFGSFNSATNNWTGVVGQLAMKKTDLGVGEFTMTNHRLDVIDFTLPLLLTRTRLYIKKPDGSAVQWSAYFRAFTFKIWMAIIVLLITSCMLLTVIRIVERNVPSVSLIFENYISVWGLFCQQGLCDFPSETPQRIAFFSILISAVVVFTAYSASLTSYLTVSSATLPFNTFPGFVNDGTFKLIVIQNSSNYDLFTTTNDVILTKMGNLMKPWRDLPKTFNEGFQQVCKERVAFYTNSAVKKVMNQYIGCKIVSIDTERVDSLAMAIGADNQYNGVVNYHLQRFQDSGILNRLKEKYITSENLSGTTYHTVNLWGVAPILSVLTGGIILAAVVLLLERFFCSLKKCSQRWTQPISTLNSNVDRRLYISDKKLSPLEHQQFSRRGDN